MSVINDSGRILLFIEFPDNSSEYKISGTNYLCFKINNKWVAEPPRLQQTDVLIGETKNHPEFHELMRLKGIDPQKNHVIVEAK